MSNNELSPEVIALRSVLRLKRIDYARSRLDYWRVRYELAGLQVDRWNDELKAAEHASETGGDPVPQKQIIY
jgi:hypothetical protein